MNWAPEFVAGTDQDVVHFTFGDYDPTLPLVVRIAQPPPPLPPITPADPRNLGWSTYAGSDQGDEFLATASDPEGDVYACGYTNEMNFPPITGFTEFPAADASFSGNHDAVVMKFKHGNKQVAWATYLGGIEGTIDFSEVGVDQATDLAVYPGTDPDLKYVFVTGSTGCNDFPTPNLETFANAVHEPWLSAYTSISAAFLTGFTMESGQLHWGTTLGAGTTGFWTAHGMGVDVNEDGKVAWCGMLRQVFGGTSFDFNPVTPTGAFTQAAGGGFYAQFDADYQYEWKTPFGSQCPDCGAYDVKIYQGVHEPYAVLIGTASTSDGEEYIFTLPTVAPTGYTGFYQGTPAGGFTDAYFAHFDMAQHQNIFCSFWGGNGNEQGIALGHNGPTFWLSGRTNSTDLDAAHLPGTGGIHDNTPGGGYDAFLLRRRFGPSILDFGSLYGGAGDDVLFDIDQRGNEVYFLGETASTSDVLFAEDVALFRQDELGTGSGANARDAILLGVKDDTRESFWSSYYGGYWSDRGWGITVTPDEVYFCGGTRSDQSTFPLLEWDTGSPLDWYDGDLLNNTTGGIGWYAYNSEYFPSDMGNFIPHDCFIVSFSRPMVVGIAASPSSHTLQASLLDPAGLWLVNATESADLQVFDVAGRLVSLRRNVQGSLLVDLRTFAPGAYHLMLSSASGLPYSAKLFKP